MTPSPPYIIKCPKCGGCRYITTMMSMSLFSTTQWSDFKVDVIAKHSTSPVLKCPWCRHYFINDKKYIVRQLEMYGKFVPGQLSYNSLKEAFKELKPTGELEVNIRTLLWRGYNDLYGGCRGTAHPSTAPTSERAYFEENLRKLITLYADEPLLVAEMYRELGEFAMCMNIISNTYIEPKLKESANKIYEHAAKGDSSVFVLRGYAAREPIQESNGNKYIPEAMGKKSFFQRLVERIIDSLFPDKYDDDEF